MSQAVHQERLMTVIRGPHLSEKAHFAAEKNQVVLKVRTDATKKEIQQAVELLAKGRRNDWKKAYVRLAEGSSLEEFFGGE
jgi:large subunit ribosomal protein L23